MSMTSIMEREGMRQQPMSNHPKSKEELRNSITMSRHPTAQRERK
jgi:hypothetical protein